MHYPKDYKEKAFLLWYENDRPANEWMTRELEPYNGETPKPQTIANWKREFGWNQRADEQDEFIRKEVEREIVEEKVRMFKRHAEDARKLQQAGWDFIEDHGVNNASQALKAIEIGLKVERESRGIPDAIEAVSGKTDRQLENTIKKLLANIDRDRLIDTGVIDGEVQVLDD